MSFFTIFTRIFLVIFSTSFVASIALDSTLPTGVTQFLSKLTAGDTDYWTDHLRSKILLTSGEGRVEDLQHISVQRGTSATFPSESTTSSSTLGENVINSLRKDSTFDAATIKKMLVWKGQIHFATAYGSGGYEDLLQKLNEHIDAVQGYVEEGKEARTESRPTCFNPDGHWTSCPRTIPATILRRYTVRWREQSEGFHSSMQTLAKFPQPNISWVTSMSTASNDVTETFVDLKAKESVLEKTRNALETLLRDMTKPSDVINVMKELQKIDTNLESLRQRANKLSKGSSLSTFHCEIVERPSEEHIVVKNPSAEDTETPWRPRNAAVRGLKWLRVGFAYAVDALILSAIIGTPVGVLVFGVLFLWRMRKQPHEHLD